MESKIISFSHNFPDKILLCLCEMEIEEINNYYTSDVAENDNNSQSFITVGNELSLINIRSSK